MNELKRVCCPVCKSEAVQPQSQYLIATGECRQLYQCPPCQRCFAQTRGTALFGLHTAVSRITLILNALTEGLSVNGACRVFHVSKKSLSLWQERFSQVKETLLLSLCHQFLSQIIEGDELYTKVKKTPSLVNPRAGLWF